MLGVGHVVAGRYRIESKLAEGGMGSIWLAEHLALGREVALKLIQDQSREDVRQRFAREARVAAQIRHRNVVDVLDFGQHTDGTPFLVMERLYGESLDQRLLRLPRPDDAEVLTWMRAALSGLAAIHDAGVVHRDLKPGNIFLARDADGVVVKVLDFGIARPLLGTNITAPASLLGTPAYMAPEQLAGGELDHRVDVWAAGVVLFEALAGRRPFRGANAFEVIAAVRENRRPRLAELRPDLDPAICELLDAALSPSAADRPASARALRQGLRSAADDSSAVSTASLPPVASAPRARRVLPTARLEEHELPDAVKLPISNRGLALAGLLGVATALAATAWAMAPGEPSAPPPPPPMAARAQSPEAPRPSSEPLEIPPTEQWVPLGEEQRAAPLVTRWRYLSPEMRAAIRFVGDGVVLTAIARPDAAAAAAAALGEEPGAPIELLAESTLTPALHRTRQRTLVRAEPRPASDASTTLSSGTLVVTLVGRFATLDSVVGESGAFARGYASASLEGWLTSTVLEDWTLCVPEAARLPPSATIAHAPIHSARAVVIFDPEDDGDITLATVDARCALTPETHGHARTGVTIDEMFLSELSPSGPLLVVLGGPSTDVARAREGGMMWSGLIADGSRFTSVWRGELYSSHDLGEGRRDRITGPARRRAADGSLLHWPIVTRSGPETTRYSWDGFALRQSDSR